MVSMADSSTSTVLWNKLFYKGETGSHFLATVLSAVWHLVQQ